MLRLGKMGIVAYEVAKTAAMMVRNCIFAEVDVEMDELGVELK